LTQPKASLRAFFAKQSRKNSKLQLFWIASPHKKHGVRNNKKVNAIALLNNIFFDIIMRISFNVFRKKLQKVFGNLLNELINIERIGYKLREENQC
jgi:hypothetical protein